MAWVSREVKDEIRLGNGTIWELDAFVEVLKDQNTRNCDLDVLNYLVTLNPKNAFDDDLSILQIHFD